MGRCCGGKNAGLPITVPRFVAGLGVFVGYHGAVHVLLRAAARPVPGLRVVRDFHKQVFKDELKEILQHDGIVVGGWLRPVEVDPCAVGVEAHTGDAPETLRVELLGAA